jgi:glycosyltransferase involved in cell wall biosynthesis
MAVAPLVTVLIPTHDHGPLLRYSVESALAQTVEELEVFVVGDGAPDVTRELMREFASRDDRVRFFDNEKGPRHGEIHRHAALAEASGDVVMYLSDDDLWFPDHVATMLEALPELDLVSAAWVTLHPDGTLVGLARDLSQSRDEFLREVRAPGIPLSCAAHTMVAYRSLPYGWRTTPDGIATDRYMWRQFLSDPSCRVGTTRRPTLLVLASTLRTSMTLDERLEEMRTWSVRVHDPVNRREIFVGVCASLVDQLLELRVRYRREREKLLRTRERLRVERERSQRGLVRSTRIRLNRVRRGRHDPPR